MNLLQAPPLSLYVHMPWCVRKCPYCDFNSHVAPAQVPERRYVNALLEDLDHDLAAHPHGTLISIFFGGGTPSLFGAAAIAEFIGGVRARLTCAQDIEVTMEANPGTIEHGAFQGYREAGVNRVSLGAQSFNEAHLRALGRIHQVDDIARCVDELHAAGIANFNLDLMYALPQQSTAQAIQDLEAAMALHPTHVSHYQLTLEPGTVFYHRPPALPDSDVSWEMQTQCQALLAGQGYDQYEVSGYARPHSRCRHNLNYWQFGDYLGVGAGAHGKLTRPVAGAVLRTTRQRQPRDYLSRTAAARTITQAVPESDRPLEYMLNALRLVEGFDLGEFEMRTGVARSCIQPQLELAQQRGMLSRHGPDRCCPTEFGRRFLNDLQALFLPA